MSIKISLDIYSNNLEYESTVTTDEFIVEDISLNLVDCIQAHLGGDRFIVFRELQEKLINKYFKDLA